MLIMGEKRSLALASPTRKSLRTTVPNLVVKTLGLTRNDLLDWEMKIIDSKAVFIVTKSSKEE